MKNLTLIFILLLGLETRAQVNCPIFPKAKKQYTHFFGNTYTSFGGDLNYFRRKVTNDSTATSSAVMAHLGVSQCFKKRLVTHTLLSFARGKSINASEGLSIGFLLGADYFFKQSFTGFGIGASLSAYGEGTHKTFHLIYTNKNKKFFNAYQFNAGFVGKNYFIGIGAKFGVLVFR